MSNKIRTIFIGTPDFGLPAFRNLIQDESFEIIAAITQPDKKIGRKQILTPPPIKVEALKNKIQVLQPEKIKTIIPEIQKLQPDVIIVIAYAQIIPEELLNIPKYGCINVHGSLLPKYRGASCIQAALLNGDKETGITIMKMDKGLDTGPILTRHMIDIEINDTAASLFDKLSNLGAKELITTVKKYIDGHITPEKQNDELASYVKMTKKEDGMINWKKSAQEIERLVRAMTPWPGAYTFFDEKMLKITETEYEVLETNNYEIGEVFSQDEKVAVQCEQNALILKKVQLSGKKEMEIKDFINGYGNFIGTVLK